LNDLTPDISISTAERRLLSVEPEDGPRDGGYLSGESQRMIVPYLAKDIEKGTWIRVGPDGQLYRYATGVYEDDGEAVVKYRAASLLGPDYAVGRVKSVVEWFADRERVNPISFEPPPGLVVYAANGIVHLDSPDPADIRLESYTPENAWLAQVPWQFDPETARSSGRLADFLDQISGKDPEWVFRVISLIGYAMLPGNPLRRALLFHGQGHNGKSILLHLMKALYGDGNVSTVSLEQLTTNRFMASQLRGKLANICGDIGPHVGDIAIFNQVTGGDSITGERKFGHPFDFRTGALPIFSSNVFPRTADPTPAYMGRYEVIPFDMQFAEDAEKEAELKGIAEDAEEMTSFFNFALLAAHDLVHHRSPTDQAVPERMREAKATFWKSVDSAKAFLEESCEVGHPDTHRESLKDLYAHYGRYCETSGMHKLSKTNFSARIEREEGVEIIKPKNVKTFTGIRVSEDWTAESGAALAERFREIVAEPSYA
jgi:P4 family phage/plasmid primase-like protien